MIQNAVDYLHKAGFTILMDDFGSGYSSLNVLKDIDIDVLKIDMRFLSKGSSEERVEKILEGYYFAKPMPKKDYVKLLQKHR